MKNISEITHLKFFFLKKGAQFLHVIIKKNIIFIVHYYLDEINLTI
jgi:hypothetical protein